MPRNAGGRCRSGVSSHAGRSLKGTTANGLPPLEERAERALLGLLPLRADRGGGAIGGAKADPMERAEAGSRADFGRRADGRREDGGCGAAPCTLAVASPITLALRGRSSRFGEASTAASGAAISC